MSKEKITIEGVQVRAQHLAFAQYKIGEEAARKLARGLGVRLPGYGEEISLGPGVRRRGSYDRNGVWWLRRHGRDFEIHFHETSSH